MGTNEKALLTALKNLVDAVNHLNVCPGTLQDAKDLIAKIEESPYKSGSELIKNEKSIHFYGNAKPAKSFLHPETGEMWSETKEAWS